MPIDYIRYDLLVQDALRSVVRKVLTEAARTGLPGEHHFNISFKTHAPGVVVPASVRQRYPDEMAIILQHEFWDLSVSADAFEVSLNFSRSPERLTIPFDSITGFSDPSVPFGFKLEPRVATEAKVVPALPGAAGPKQAIEAPAQKTPRAVVSPPGTGPRTPETTKSQDKAGEKASEGAPAKVVSIDAFRKK